MVTSLDDATWDMSAFRLFFFFAGVDTVDTIAL